MNYKEKFLKLFNFFTKKEDTNKNGKYISYKDKEKVEEWFKDGQLHREDGPAIITKTSNFWYKNGELHRIGGPAISHQNCKIFNHNPRTEWWENGKLHRIDGPAVTDTAGYSEWFKDGQLHREDGPAIIKDDGDQYYLQWWVNGQELSYQEFQKFLLHEEFQKDVLNKDIKQTKKVKI